MTTTARKYSCGVTIPGPGEIIYSSEHINENQPTTPSKNTILICAAFALIPTLIGCFIGFSLASNQAQNQVRNAELKAQTAQAEAALAAAKMQRIKACIEEIQ